MGVLEWIDECEEVTDEVMASGEAVIEKTSDGNIISTEEEVLELGEDASEFWDKEAKDEQGVPCVVEVKIGLTINIGPYENVKPTVGIKIPSGAKNISGAYKFAYDFVDAKLAEIRKDVEDTIDG